MSEQLSSLYLIKKELDGTKREISALEANITLAISGTVNLGYLSTVSGLGSTILGGSKNCVLKSNYSSTLGGFCNNISGLASVIAGGQVNGILGNNSAIFGGIYNCIGCTSPIHSLSLAGHTPNSIIAGGCYNGIKCGCASFIGGGVFNTILNSTFSSINAGCKNVICGGSLSFIGGGEENITCNTSAVIAGGRRNCAIQNYSVIGGGNLNRALGSCSTVGGGYGNHATDILSTIGGGHLNYATANSSTVGGGAYNCAISNNSIIGGGTYNCATGIASTVGGGINNLAVGNYSTVGGGRCNCATIKISYVEEIFIEEAEDTSEGTYTRNSGGTTTFYGPNGNYIEWNGSEWVLWDENFGDYTYYNNNFELNSSNWETLEATVPISAIENTSIYDAPNGNSATIGGGEFNCAAGSFSIVGGGERNCALSSYSYIIGGRCSVVEVSHSGAAVLGDGQNRQHLSSGPHTLTLDFISGIYVKNRLIFNNSYTPSFSEAFGISGQIAADSNYIYYHDGVRWRRTALAEW